MRSSIEHANGQLDPQQTTSFAQDVIDMRCRSQYAEDGLA